MRFKSDEELLGKLSAELGSPGYALCRCYSALLPELEQLIAGEAVHRRKRRRKELLLFLLVALVLVTIVISILSTAPVLYWSLQAVFILSALGSLGAARIRHGREES